MGWRLGWRAVDPEQQVGKLEGRVTAQQCTGCEKKTIYVILLYHVGVARIYISGQVSGNVSRRCLGVAKSILVQVVPLREKYFRPSGCLDRLSTLTDRSATRQNRHQAHLLTDSADSGDDFGGLADRSVSVDRRSKQGLKPKNYDLARSLSHPGLPLRLTLPVYYRYVQLLCHRVCPH